MKKLITVAALLATLNLYSAPVLSDQQLEQKYGKIADAIYKLEGGTKTKHPYGVLSIKTNNPRRVCLVTIYHNELRWKSQGSHGDYLDYLADVYCPRSADPKGNKNWHNNIHKLI